MESLTKKIENNIGIVFAVLDIFIIFISSYVSFLLRFDGSLPANKSENFLAFTLLSVVLTIIIFSLRGLYGISWKYVSITDLPDIFYSVVISGFAIGASLFLLRDNFYFANFPRSIIFIYTILLFLFSGFLRFSKRIYWQILKPNGSLLQVKELALPLTAETLNSKEVKNVLVTGGAGYIGSVLSRKLLQEGYNVTVLDKLIFGKESIQELQEKENFHLIEGDIFDKDILIKALSNADAVVNLAAIVGEAACLSQKDVALQTNYLGAVYVARICKALGVKRFIQASTCSTYGFSEDFIARESSKLFPVDFYGETKIYAERELMKLADENFMPTILRFSTVYGLSQRMRFDLVVNTFVKKAILEKEITIFGGEQWRPLIHVSDIAGAILLMLKVPLNKVANQVFNVGGNDENYIISDLGKIVKEFIPSVKIKTINSITDKRSYKVDFSKIEKVLGFKPEKNVKDGIIEIRDAIKNNQFENLEDKKYYNHLVI